MKVRKGQRDNGRWYIYWRDQEGNRRSRSLGPSIDSEIKAEKIRARHEEMLRQSKLGHLDPSRVRLGGFRAEYIAHRQRLARGDKDGGLSPETVRQDAKSLQSLIDVLGANSLLRNITQRKLEHWSGTLLQRGLSAYSIRSYLSHILAALEKAVSWGHLAAMPRIKRKEVIKTPRRRPRRFLPEQKQAFIDGEPNPERRAAWKILFGSGLRLEEACSLRREQVRLQVDYPHCIVIGKGDKERVVPLLPEAVEGAEYFLARGPGSGPLFLFTFGQRPGRARILELQKEHSNQAIGRMYGVSDVTVGKWSRVEAPDPRPVNRRTLSKWFLDRARELGLDAISTVPVILMALNAPMKGYPPGPSRRLWGTPACSPRKSIQRAR